MPLTIRHKKFGKWQVLDGENVIAEDLTKAEAQMRAGLPVDAAVSAPPPRLVAGEDSIPTHADGRELTELERRREYERRLERDLKVEAVETAKATFSPFRAVCVASFEAGTADRVCQLIEPIVQAGPERLRRTSRTAA